MEASWFLIGQQPQLVNTNINDHFNALNRRLDDLRITMANRSMIDENKPGLDT